MTELSQKIPKSKQRTVIRELSGTITPKTIRYVKKGAKLGLKLRNLDNGVFNALIEVLGSKMICWEESNASKKGYEMLKKYNLTEEELKIAKENMDNALEMYKLQGEIAWKQKLINSGLKNL